jgi:hypothetical protein
MQLLMAKVMSTRLMAEDSEQLLDHIEQENDLGLTPVLHFEASPSVDDPSRMNIQAMTSNGSLPAIEVSYHWALTNGPHALQVLLAEAFGMGEEPHASFRQSAPMESEPLHPGWKRALPPAPGLH